MSSTISTLLLVRVQAVREAEAAPASPRRVARAEVVLLVNSLELGDFSIGEVDNLLVRLDARGRHGLREDWIERDQWSVSGFGDKG